MVISLQHNQLCPHPPPRQAIQSTVGNTHQSMIYALLVLGDHTGYKISQLLNAWQIYKAFFTPALMILKDSLSPPGSGLLLIAMQLAQYLLVSLKCWQKKITSA